MKTTNRKKILRRTNLLICLIIVCGFALSAVIGCGSNYRTATKNIEHTSRLTAEGIYHQIAETFAIPLNVSRTMAKDRFLVDFLAEESNRLEEEGYIKTIKSFLASYKEQYGYESVFLVSDATKRYYNFNGIDRMVDDAGNSENEWYYDFKARDAESNLVIDNDQVAGAKNEITVFVNYKIEDAAGKFLGVVGVGMVVDHFQSLMQGYEREYGVKVNLLNEYGIVQISPRHYGYGTGIDWFEKRSYPASVRASVLGWTQPDESFELWTEEIEKEGEEFIVVRYFPEIKWTLVVEQDMAEEMSALHAGLLQNILIVLALILLITTVVAFVIVTYDKKIRSLNKSVEESRNRAFEEAAANLFEKIYEFDVTHNRAGNRETEAYFQSLGAPRNAPVDKFLEIVAEKQIKEEFRRGYVETFTPQNVLRAYAEGRHSLTYEFMILGDDGEYHWMRIVVQIVRWESDGSVHMYSYRQNIDAEKLQEQKMSELAETDEMTGFWNKTATEKRIEALLERNPDKQYAFFIFDIDYFKTANDEYGHAFGDGVILAFTDALRTNFRSEDILGRIGGDEFVAFYPYGEKTEVETRAKRISRTLDCVYEADGGRWRMSASIGIALAPEEGTDFNTLYRRADAALYVTKAKGKNGYTLYGDMELRR